MNNHGQSLVVFILLLPLILLAVGVIIEESIIYYNKYRLTSITKTILSSTIETNDKNDIINLYNKNGVYEDFDISFDNGTEVKFTSKVNSFLGKIISKDYYEIDIDIKATKENNQIKFEKGN